MPALNDRKPSDFPDLQSPPEGKKTEKLVTMYQALRIQTEFQKEKLYFTCLDFIAPYLPSLCVFNSSLRIFDVVVQNESHSFHPVKYNLAITAENRESKFQRAKKKEKVQ